MIAQWAENDVIVNGATFHYYRTGDGSKPALVLCHGFSDNGLCWLPVARDLEADFDVVMMDARGHGKSQRVKPGEVFSHAADLAGVIQALGLKRPVVGGHSMGASTAAELGACWAHLVRALILEDPGWWDPEPEPKETRPNPWHTWLKRLPEASVEQVIAKGRADNPTWAEIEMRPWAESKKQLDLNILEAQPSRMEWKQVAQALVCPTLLITADVSKGAIVTPAMADKAWELSNYIQVAVISGAGHNIRRENYAEYMQAVKDFLGKIK